MSADAPGVVALGQTRDEVADGIREALGAYAADLTERGLQLPAAHHSADTIAARIPGRDGTRLP